MKIFIILLTVGFVRKYLNKVKWRKSSYRITSKYPASANQDHNLDLNLSKEIPIFKIMIHILFSILVQTLKKKYQDHIACIYDGKLICLDD